MKKLLLSLTLITLTISAFAQDFQWAKRIGGATMDEGISVAVDASGNSYSTGSFRGTVDFDPGAGTSNLVAVGDNDIYVVKLDAAGNFAWAQSFGSSNYEVGIDIAVDASGNVYVTGNYSGSIDFDPGAATTTLTSAGQPDIFILKLTTSGGFVFAKSMGGTTVDVGYSIAVDASGNIYTTGSYSGTADFDPGAAVYNLSSLKAGNDIFVSKLNSSGNFVWAKTAGGGSPDQGTSIAVDAAGNVYVTGFNNADANFNPAGSGAGGFVTYVGSTDIFILKFDTGGGFMWVKGIGSTGADVGYSIAVDALGNIYTTGYFFGTADFDPGAATYPLTSAGTNVDVFISKLNTSGTFVWARNMGGTNGDVGYSISVDAIGNVYTYGSFAGTSDFDPGAATHDLAAIGLADVFISKLDVSGNFISAKTFGGSGDDIGYCMVMDGAGNMYTVGKFTNSSDFDPATGEFNLTSAGNSDIFLSKIGTTPIFPVTLLSFEAVKNLNDAYLTWTTSTEINSDKFEIERSIDGRVFNYIGQVKASGSSIIKRTYNFTDKSAAKTFPNQAIYYRFKQSDLNGKFTYSPIRSINFSHDLAAVRVYPNPSNNILAIHANIAQVGVTYNITDNNGKKVFTGKLNSNTTIVNIGHLASGVYFVRIGDLLKQSIKVVKQ